MKIDKTTPAVANSSLGEITQRTAAAKQAPSQAASTSVNLGTAGAQMQVMANSMAGTPTVNAAKVAEIKQAISEGRFQVNAGAIADGLISSVRDMINTAQQRR